MKKPLISIVLPVLNGEKYLSLAINSVIAQTYKNWKLIIVDNGSTDNTPAIINEYLKKDTRIKGINCNIKGIVPALNTGLKHCVGTLIARIDADDLWIPNKLEVQVNYLNSHPQLALLGGSVEIIDDKGNTLPNTKAFNNGMHLDPKEVVKKISHNNLFCHSSIVIKKEVLEEFGGYAEKYLHSEDYFLWFQTVQKYKAEILAEKLVLFRYHPQSISRKFILEQQKSSLALRRTFCYSIGNPLVNLAYILKDTILFYLRLAKSYLLELHLFKRTNKRNKESVK